MDDLYQHSSPRKTPLRRLFFLSCSIFILALLTLVGTFLYRTLTLGQHLQWENTSHRSFLSELGHLTTTFINPSATLLRGEQDGRINIVLLGRAGEHYPGKNLTDTVMIMSIDTKNRRVALISLPRDLYVPIGENTDYFTKLNALYQYGLSNGTGVEPLEKTLTIVTGIPIHYFITLDFDGFERVVDTLGGISVDVPRDFSDPRYPGKNYSYETFTIKKGWQVLDGATALKYVRERHNDPEGDFGRAKRQQQVIEALKNKTFSLGTLFNIVTVNRLLDTLGDSVKTDMTIEEMTRFLELAHSLDTTNVATTVIDAWKKESLLRVSHLQIGDIAAFILVPRVGNWSEVQDACQNVFALDEANKRLEQVTDEHPTLTLYALSSDRGSATKMIDLLKEEMGFRDVTLETLPSLSSHPKQSILLEENALAKPYSLDELLHRFSLQKTTILPFTPASQPVTTSDFTIVLGSDLAETFSHQDATSDPLPEDSPSTEPLTPQHYEE